LIKATRKANQNFIFCQRFFK